MNCRLIDLSTARLARFFLLVQQVRPVELEGTRSAWAILVEGRGFKRIIREEILATPGLIRALGWNLPKPKTFPSRVVAENYLRHVGLWPAQKSWRIRDIV